MCYPSTCLEGAGGNKLITPPILNFGTKWRCMVNFTRLLFNPRWKNLYYLLNRRMGGPRTVCIYAYIGPTHIKAQGRCFIWQTYCVTSCLYFASLVSHWLSVLRHCYKRAESNILQKVASGSCKTKLWAYISYTSVLSIPIFTYFRKCRPIPVAARYKAWVCGRSLVGIASLNTVGSIDVCLLWFLCLVKYRVLRRADHSSRGVLPSVACISVINKPHRGGLGQLGLSVLGREITVVEITST
jgi:hypothetical protein